MGGVSLFLAVLCLRHESLNLEYFLGVLRGRLRRYVRAHGLGVQSTGLFVQLAAQPKRPQEGGHRGEGACCPPPETACQEPDHFSS